jgi:hypothetical protein
MVPSIDRCSRACFTERPVRVTHHQAHNKLIKHINSDIISEDVEEDLQSVLDLRNLEKVPVCSCHGLFVICYSCTLLCLRGPVDRLVVEAQLSPTSRQAA